MTITGVRTRLWRSGVLEKEDFPFADISDYVCQDDCLVWIGLRSPDAEVLNGLAEELSLDPLAVEDAIAHRERPKASHYDSHTFLSAYALELDHETSELKQTQVSAFVLPHAMVSVHTEDWFDIDAVLRRWDQDSELIKLGSKTLAYHLLDYLVDGHFDVIQSLDDEIEALEDVLFDDSPNAAQKNHLQRRTFALRKALVQARRVILPMREVLNTMVRRDSVMPEPLRPYFEDLYDHVLRASEWTESLRDMISSVFETNLSLADARLNTIMKKLTSWAAIIAIPTAVTGFYGQNVPYPGFGQHWGFATSSAIMVGLVVSLYVLFKKKEWL
ncbi:magnesium transporter CorA family protein [Jatrophihabitans telluris]|uniref:Magnesium transporter CorA family protein n=1 Tax=Jatrophihabitans telluris TaxID=2038343 RepID=A0ABY4QWI5_9ACTN|nr:magnesium transporter CorA family protein [Jatrophihabitans telluris]UQX87890.1 magnesium transporter CorA family protein [Jatrophihabitans telluris]